jgi:hypothetical protein
MLFARQLIVNAAAAYGLQAIDLVKYLEHCTLYTYINMSL